MENLLKDQSNFPLVIILLILITFSLGEVLINIMVRRSLMLVTLGLEGLKTEEADQNLSGAANIKTDWHTLVNCTGL